jgi:phospho-N-acetylmuramoyl-pentapeptide-transferase
MVASASMTEAAVAMAVAALLTRIVIAVAVRGSILAIPNQRSSHALPTPTMGGVAIALPVLAWCGYRIGQDPLCWAALGGGGMLALLGLADDLRDLSARVRLPIQGIAVAVALSALPIAIPLVLPPISIQMPWLVVSLDFLIVLWMVNLYNFMDGIDGLATSQCVVYCAAVLLIGHPVAFTSELLWILLGTAAGFLWFNRAPARIFMGDVGALGIGASLGMLAVTSNTQLLLPIIAGLQVMEIGSVALQMGTYRLSGRSRRLFKMSPIHHHFELGGWDEEKITIRFWIVGILAALLGVTLFLASLDKLQ